MAVGEHEIVVCIASIGEEGLEDFRREEAARILGGVVGEKLEGEHVGAERECNPSVGG